MSKVEVTKKTSILDLVNYNAPIRYELRNPANNSGLGVVFELVSVESDQARQVFHDHLMQPGVEQKIAGTDRVTLGMQIAKERIAAAIVGWDFGGNVLEDGDDAEPELTFENKMKLLSKDWIQKQLDAQVGNIGNFMKR